MHVWRPIRGRSGRGCYYFGDYFGPTYATAGYVSWVGYSGGSNVVVVRGWYDPMYSYYRVSYRDDPYWRGGITELYVGRYRGDIAPPPRTLVQQTTIINNNTVINNTVVNNTVNKTNVINNKNVNVSNVNMLTPISQIATTNPNIKMQTISAQARVEQQQGARNIAVVGQQRSQMETRCGGQVARPIPGERCPSFGEDRRFQDAGHGSASHRDAGHQRSPTRPGCTDDRRPNAVNHGLPIVPSRATPAMARANSTATQGNVPHTVPMGGCAL